MRLTDVFAALQANLELSQYPGRKFKYGIPSTPASYDAQDHLPPGLYLDWWKGRFTWMPTSCDDTQLKAGEGDFNALIVLDQDKLDMSQFPGLLPNEALALHMLDLGETLVAKVIALRKAGTFAGFFAAPMTLTHSFVKDEPTSLVNLLIRVSQIDGYGE